MRSKRRRLQIFGLSIFCAMVVAAPVHPQDRIGVLDAIGESVSESAPIRVSAAHFNDLNQRLEPRVEKVLRDRGYTVDRKARLTLSFSTGSTMPSERAQSTALDVRTSAPDPGTDSEEPSAAARRRNPLLHADTPRQRGTSGFPGGRSYSLSFFVGRPGEAPLWQGSVGARMTERDALKATERLVPVLVDHLGMTMRGYSVEIP